MNHSQLHARQPLRDVWSHDKLTHMRAYALAHTLATSTSSSYSSTLHSYLLFCQNHDFHIEPTEETLSLYTVYMSYHVKPSSISSYLSGIQNQLEVYFPNIHKVHASPLVSKTLRGCKCLRGSPVKCKSPLETSHMQLLVQTYGPSDLHDDRLFLVQVTSGFSALNCLEELVWPDSTKLQTYQSLPLRHSVTCTNNSYSYTLPCTKTD